MPTSIAHTVRMKRNARWTCTCRARGVGEASAEAHAFAVSGTVETGALAR